MTEFEALLINKKLPRGLGCLGLILAVGLCTFFGAWILFAMVIYPIAHQGTKTASCQNNLKQIGICLRLYADEHDGKWPATLHEMYPEYISDFSVVLCPSSDTKSGAIEDLDHWSDYTYSPFYGTGDPAKVVVCRDKEAIHRRDAKRGGGSNELFADGHVEFRYDDEAVSK